MHISLQGTLGVPHTSSQQRRPTPGSVCLSEAMKAFSSLSRRVQTIVVSYANLLNEFLCPRKSVVAGYSTQRSRETIAAVQGTPCFPRPESSYAKQLAMLSGTVFFAWTESPSLERSDKTRLGTTAVWGPVDKQDIVENLSWDLGW